MRKTFPNFRSKIRPLQGDCLEPFCGLSPKDQEMLYHEVTMCFNLTADVRLIQTLKCAVIGNILATKNILTLVKQMKNLKVFKSIVQVFFCCKLISRGLYTFLQLTQIAIEIILMKYFINHQ